MSVDQYSAGTLAGAGSFCCHECGFAVALMAMDAVPECPSCGSRSFRRASMFAEPKADSAPSDEEPPDWLAELREEIADQGHFLAFMDDDRVSVLPLTKEWTRIGRSEVADVRLDDPTVSRRHALVVRKPNDVRVLDDRSLNGVFLNGERVDWHRLTDGDQLTVGRFSVYFLDTTETAEDARFASRGGTALA